MPDIVTLTINPAVDIFVNVARVEPTSKLRCSSPKRDPGGGGINVARVVHRLGGDVAAIYPAGGAIGKLLHRLVEREGIDSIVTPSHVETRENFTAYEEESGQQYRFVLPGSPLHRPNGRRCSNKLDRPCREKPRIVVASGSVPPGVPDDILRRRGAPCPRARRQDGDRHVRRRAQARRSRRRHADQAEPERAQPNSSADRSRATPTVSPPAAS